MHRLAHARGSVTLVKSTRLLPSRDRKGVVPPEIPKTVKRRKHGGLSDSDNLAYACLRCNAWKGSDIGSRDTRSGAFVSLFHRRRQRWADRFVLLGAVIEPLTPEGKATASVLKLNLDKRVVERRLLATTGRYPG